MNVEEKSTITIEEYKAWLAGFTRGLDGRIIQEGDLELIVTMADKVVEQNNTPIVPYYPQYPYTTPTYPNWWEVQPSTSAGQDGDNITINDGGSSASFDFSSLSCATYGYGSCGEPIQICTDNTAYGKPTAFTDDAAGQDLLAMIRSRASEKARVTSDAVTERKERLAKLSEALK